MINREFPETRDSLVVALASDASEEQHRAFELVVRAYRAPVLALLRRRWSLEPADAEDMAQEFFATALEKSWLSRYDATRGRFRTFLRSCLFAFVSTERQAANRLKRGGGVQTVSLDAHTPTPESESEVDALFEQEWIRSVLGMALDALRAEAELSGRDASWAVFERYDIRGAEADVKLTYAEVARELDLPVTQVTNYLAWARRRFREHLFATVRALTTSDEEYREEDQAAARYGRAMTELSDRAVARLREVMDLPETADGRYVVREEIGRGGMGVVFRAHDTRLNREVALKVLRAEMNADARADANAKAIGPSAGDRLVREARILAHLDHPGIVTVHDTGRLMDGRVYYVMRLVRGMRLDAHAASGVGRGDLLRIVLRLCETVAFAHDHGIVHRDLKPGNVMIGPFGEVMVLDWGVAKMIGADRKGASESAEKDESALSAQSARSQYPAVTAITADHADYADTALRGLNPIGDENSATASSSVSASFATLDGMVIGTSGYMAPEQAAGDSAWVDARADVYGLGAILRELVIVSDAPVPRPLRAIVERATATQVSDRYASATVLGDDVRHWLDGEAVSAHREGTLERAARFYRRHEVAVLLLLAYVVVRTIIVFWRRF